MAATRFDATRIPAKAIDPFFESLWRILAQIFRFLLGLFPARLI